MVHIGKIRNIIFASFTRVKYHPHISKYALDISPDLKRPFCVQKIYTQTSSPRSYSSTPSLSLLTTLWHSDDQEPWEPHPLLWASTLCRSHGHKATRKLTPSPRPPPLSVLPRLFLCWARLRSTTMRSRPKLVPRSHYARSAPSSWWLWPIASLHDRVGELCEFYSKAQPWSLDRGCPPS